MTPATQRALPLLAALFASCQQPPQPTPIPPLESVASSVSEVPPKTDGLLTVMQSAVVERGGLTGVFLMLDGRARFQPVRMGHRKGRNVEILAGLWGGEVLVTGELEAVLDGTPIVVKP